MNDYERELFNGKCPYTGLICDKDIECFVCPVEEEERKFMRAIWEVEDGNVD